MENSLYDQYEQFLAEPTAYRYRRVRRLLMQCCWPVDPLSLLEAESLIDKDPHEAERVLEHHLPAWLLSPRWHFLAEKIALLRQDAEAEHADRFQMHACLKGIMRTGDGSASSPFLVTYPTDATDVIWALHLEADGHQRVRAAEGCLEIIRCGDGREVWFDCSAFAAADSALVQDHHRAEPLQARASHERFV
ncbi:MAG: hypothetical protein AAGF97_14630 [Planctomycetota bacterium]